MDRPRRDSRQHNRITVRGQSQLTSATKSALFGHAAISELSLLSGVKRKLDFEPAKGSFWREADTRRNDKVRKVPIVLQKSKKALCDQFSAKGRNKRQSPINATSNPSPKSPVSLSYGDVVPHIIIRSSRLRHGEFESHAAKRLLQHYLPIPDLRWITATSDTAAQKWER